MPDEEVKPIEEIKPPEPPKEEAPKAEPVIVEPQREVNPLEARLEAIEKRLNDRDEKEKIAAEQSKETKKEIDHDETRKHPVSSEKTTPTGGENGSGDKVGAGVKPVDKSEPVNRKHRFKFKRKPAKQ